MSSSGPERGLRGHISRVIRRDGIELAGLFGKHPRLQSRRGQPGWHWAEVGQVGRRRVKTNCFLPGERSRAKAPRPDLRSGLGRGVGWINSNSLMPSRRNVGGVRRLVNRNEAIFEHFPKVDIHSDAGGGLVKESREAAASPYQVVEKHRLSVRECSFGMSLRSSASRRRWPLLGTGSVEGTKGIAQKGRLTERGVVQFLRKQALRFCPAYPLGVPACGASCGRSALRWWLMPHTT
ncbi:hypothetical protein GOBAR_AA32104 [Gossypium barbadense]|uniref:Uncharacterized protein n=1 Tax=Gossypium barbadense TaxID=3634 RepID=A0A2P5WBX2_GOSBA|nr:hypothetical protein GOBAR_AA32104 [Gossypium barbadense]